MAPRAGGLYTSKTAHTDAICHIRAHPTWTTSGKELKPAIGTRSRMPARPVDAPAVCCPIVRVCVLVCVVGGWDAEGACEGCSYRPLLHIRRAWVRWDSGGVCCIVSVDGRHDRPITSGGQRARRRREARPANPHVPHASTQQRILLEQARRRRSAAAADSSSASAASSRHVVVFSCRCIDTPPWPSCLLAFQ